MGKTSTTKASKKKTVSKKQESAKKVKADQAAPGKTSDLKTEETPATVALKGPKDSKKTVDAGIPIQKKPVLISDLILKKFDAWQPDNLFVPIPDKSTIADAPPFISGKDDQEISQKRILLFNSFDMKAIIAEGERFAIEKAEAERMLPAEKAEAERIAAEKAAAEKAEAERIAAEKAAAEKAEAERIAAEKAAAEKAEANDCR